MLFFWLLLFLLFPTPSYSNCTFDVAGAEEPLHENSEGLDDLMVRVRDFDDRVAFEKLRQAFQSFVGAMLRRYIAIFPDEHPDLEQEIFLGLWKSRAGFTGGVKGRVAAITKNICYVRINFWRAGCRDYRRTISIDSTASDGTRVDLSPYAFCRGSAEDAATERDLRRVLAARIDAAGNSDIYRFTEIARSYLIDGKNNEQIASDRGLTIQTVEYRLRKGLRVLRDARVFDDLGISFDDELPEVITKPARLEVPIAELTPVFDFVQQRQIAWEVFREWTTRPLLERNLVRLVLWNIPLPSASFRLGLSPAAAHRMFSDFELAYASRLRRIDLKSEEGPPLLGLLSEELNDLRKKEPRFRLNPQWVIDNWVVTSKFKSLKTAWASLGDKIEALPEALRLVAKPIWLRGPLQEGSSRREDLERVELYIDELMRH